MAFQNPELHFVNQSMKNYYKGSTMNQKACNLENFFFTAEIASKIEISRPPRSIQGLKKLLTCIYVLHRKQELDFYGRQPFVVST